MKVYLAHVDAAHTAVSEGASKIFKENPVGGKGDLIETLDLAESFSETYESFPDPGFPTREPYLANPLFRHTIDTSQVATIGYGKTEIIDDPVMIVSHRPFLNFVATKFDEFVKSLKRGISVIPANPGSGPGQAPESSYFQYLKILWTPVSTGVTTFYEIIKFV